jgi:hypothetical protein
MASTYSALKIELIGTGEQSGTWGATSNVNFDTALGEAITGSADVNFATAADVTVTLTDTNTTQTARNLRLNITESSTGVGYVGNLILGSGCQIKKLYLVNNGTTAAKTIKNTTGTGISVPAGKSVFLFNTGVNVVDATTYLSSLSTVTLTTTGAASIGTTLTVAADGTFSGTGQVKLPAGTTAQRSGSPAVGMIRYNNTIGSFEGYQYSVGSVISSLTNVVTLATANTITNHNLSTGDIIVMSGCTPSNYNGTYSVTVTGLTTFTYTMAADPGSSATVIGTYTYANWGALGTGSGSGGGASAGGAIYENKQTITANYTMTTYYNGHSVGPITINSGVSVTVPTGSIWLVQ